MHAVYTALARLLYPAVILCAAYGVAYMCAKIGTIVFPEEFGAVVHAHIQEN